MELQGERRNVDLTLLRLAPARATISTQAKPGPAAEKAGGGPDDPPGLLTLTGTSALQSKQSRHQALVPATYGAMEDWRQPSLGAQGQRNLHAGSGSASQLLTHRVGASSFDQLPRPRAMQVGSRVNIGQYMPDSHQQFTRVRGLGLPLLSKKQALLEERLTAVAQGLTEQRPSIRQTKSQLSHPASSEGQMDPERLHYRLRSTISSKKGAHDPRVLGAVNLPTVDLHTRNAVPKPASSFQSLARFDANDPYGSRKTRNGPMLLATGRQLEQQFRSAGHLRNRKSSQGHLVAAEYEGTRSGLLPAGRTADSVMRYFQQATAPVQPTTRSLEGSVPALSKDTAAQMSSAAMQPGQGARGPRQRLLANAAPNQARIGSGGRDKTTQTLQITMDQPPEARSLAETVHFPDLAAGQEVAAASEQSSTAPLQGPSLSGPIPPQGSPPKADSGEVTAKGSRRRQPEAAKPGLELPLPQPRRRIPTKRAQEREERPIWGVSGSRNHVNHHQSYQESREGVGYLTEHLYSADELFQPPTEFDNGHDGSASKTSTSQLGGKANELILNNETELPARYMKWYENSREQRWRRCELARVLRRRHKATRAMDQEIMIKRLAGQILSSTYFLEEEAKSLLNPYDQLDQEVAEAAGRVIVGQLKANRKQGHQAGVEQAQDSLFAVGKTEVMLNAGSSKSYLAGSQAQRGSRTHRQQTDREHSSDPFSINQLGSILEGATTPYADAEPERRGGQGHLQSQREDDIGNSAQPSLSDMRSLLMDAIKHQRTSGGSPERFRGLIKLQESEGVEHTARTAQYGGSGTARARAALSRVQEQKAGWDLPKNDNNYQSDAYLRFLEKEQSIRGFEEEQVRRIVESMDDIVQESNEVAGSGENEPRKRTRAHHVDGQKDVMTKNDAQTRPQMAEYQIDSSLKPVSFADQQAQRIEKDIDSYVEQMRAEIKKKRQNQKEYPTRNQQHGTQQQPSKAAYATIAGRGDHYHGAEEKPGDIGAPRALDQQKRSEGLIQQDIRQAFAAAVKGSTSRKRGLEYGLAGGTLRLNLPASKTTALSNASQSQRSLALVGHDRMDEMAPYELGHAPQEASSAMQSSRSGTKRAPLYDTASRQRAKLHLLHKKFETLGLASGSTRIESEFAYAEGPVDGAAASDSHERQQKGGSLRTETEASRREADAESGSQPRQGGPVDLTIPKANAQSQQRPIKKEDQHHSSTQATNEPSNIPKDATRKKFDFIMYCLAQFEKIRSSEGTSQDRGAVEAADEDVEAPKDLYDPETPSGDEYQEKSQDDRPLDLKNTIIKKQGAATFAKAGQSAAQLIAKRLENRNPELEKERLQKQLLENHELRAFLDEHEQAISRTLDLLLRDQIPTEQRGGAGRGGSTPGHQGNTKSGSMGKHGEPDGRKQAPAGPAVAAARQEWPPKQAMANQRRSTSTKEFYANWLISFFVDDEEGPGVAGGSIPTDQAPMRAARRRLGGKGDGLMPSTEVIYEHDELSSKNSGPGTTGTEWAEWRAAPTREEIEQQKQRAKEKELVRAYLFRRIGRLAEENGTLDRLRAIMEERQRLRHEREFQARWEQEEETMQSQDLASVEGAEEEESEVESQSKELIEGTDLQMPQLGLGVEFQEQYDLIDQPMPSPTTTQAPLEQAESPLENATRAGSKSPRLSIPLINLNMSKEQDGMLASGRKSRVTARALPSIVGASARLAHGKKSSRSPYQYSAHAGVSRGPSPGIGRQPPSEYSDGQASSRKRAAEHKLIANYGKWYMKPSDFNQSLQSRLHEKEMKEKHSKEVEEEQRLHDNAKFFLRNYKLLGQPNELNTKT